MPVRKNQLLASSGVHALGEAPILARAGAASHNHAAVLGCAVAPRQCLARLHTASN